IILLKTKPESNAAKNPKTYIMVITKACNGTKPKIYVFGMMSDMMIMYTGIRAEHVVNGVTSMVINRSFGFSILRALMIAGIAQAVPDTNGTTDFPLKPKGFMIQSIIKTTRLM